MRRAFGTRIYRASDNDPALLYEGLRSGALTRVRRGAYADLDTSGSPLEQARRAAVLHAEAVHAQFRTPHWFSHETAALLWGLPTRRPPQVTHLIQHVRPRSGLPRTVARHVGVVDPDDQAIRRNLPLTGLARTVADCATGLPELDALIVIDAALGASVDSDRVEEILRCRAGHRGVRRARRVWSLGDGRAESPGETTTRYRIHELGWPAPQLQVPIPTPEGTFYVDLGWPNLKLGIEYDGEVKYRELADGDPAAVIIREKHRHGLIDREGWILARVMKQHVRSASAFEHFIAPYVNRAIANTRASMR